MNILCTGSQGLIGSHICKELERRKLHYKGIDVDEYNLINPKDTQKLFDNFDSDIIIHTAAISHIPTIKKYPFETMANNVGSVNALLYIAGKKKIKHFIYLSSCSVYGDIPHSYLSVDEDFPLNPKGVYGATKACGELLCMACYKQLGLPVTILRLSNVYGQGDRHSRVIPNFIKATLSNKPLIVESNVIKEFTYIDDVINAILLCLDNKESKGEIFNIHGGQATSITQLAEIIKQIIPETQIEYKTNNDREQTDRGNISIRKAKEVLGYEPKVALKEGLRRTIEWHKLNSTE